MTFGNKLSMSAVSNLGNSKMQGLTFAAAWTLLFISSNTVFATDEDPCYRSCNASEPPMTCSYKFVLETTYTMSRACYDCPSNITDCYRPQCVTADGVGRALMTVNRQLPGPLIQVCQGDTIQVDVTNGIAGTGAGIHWHGIHQRGTPYMDGVPMMTQCPIVTGTTFQYTFTAENAGTNFWHAHSGIERADGIFGGLIVRQDPAFDPNHSLYDEDLEEHVIVFTDWAHALIQETYAGGYFAAKTVYPETILVNGRGKVKDQVSGAWTSIPYSFFNVEKGRRYRMRLINSGSLDCPIRFSVDNHPITIIALDGVPITPIVVDYIDTFSGERYDIVLNADQPISSYWMQFMGLTHCAFTQAYQMAVLHYTEANVDLPPYAKPDYTDKVPSGKVFNLMDASCNDTTDNAICVSEITALEPMEPTLANKQVDNKLFLSIDFRQVPNANYYDSTLYPPSAVSNDKQITSPQISNISFAFPSSPPLSQHDDVPASTYCSGNNPPANCNLETDYCQCTHSLELSLNSTTEIIFVDQGTGGEETHPFHMHGYLFYVVGMERLQQDQPISIQDVQDLDEKGLLQRNLINPVLRDTIAIPNKGYAIIRLQATNPGYWLFHCHLALHSAAGMDMVVHVGEPQDLPPIPNGFPKCGNFNSN